MRDLGGTIGSEVHDDEPRTLQRVTLGRYTPSELVPNLAELLAAR